MAALTPVPKIQFFDNNGNPLSGGKLYSYDAGTTTPRPTYTNYGGGTANTNPVILDSRGEANIWLDSALYKLKLTSATDVEIWTVDNVGGPDQATLAQLAASGGSNLIGFIQDGTGAVTRTAQSKMRDVVSVKDFGAGGDGVTDDTSAIQAACNYAQTLSGATVYFPAGEYKITSAIDVPSAISLEGCGQASILRAYSCHGLNFLASSVVGARKVANLWLYADAGSNYQGIRVNLDSTIGNRITGVTFDNVYISWFGTAVYARGLWHSAFTNCYLLNCYTGILFEGQSVVNSVIDTKITRGNPLVTGTGDSRGVSIRETSGVRPEDVSLRGSLIFGFDVAVHVHNVLFANVIACDLDYCQKKGVEALQVDGGFVVRDSWIALDAASATAAQRGVDFVNLGTVRRSNACIENNRFNRGNTTGGDHGVRVGSNQECVVIDGNSFNSFNYGVYVDGANKTKICNNSIDAAVSVFLYSCDATDIRGNYFANNMETSTAGTGVTNTQYGFNSGVQTTYAVGQITVPSGATSATASLASLGLAPVVLGVPSRHKYFITFANNGTTNRNSIWGSCDGTNITVRVETSFGVTFDQQFILQVF